MEWQPKIKPLVWEPMDDICSRERAPAFGGEYRVVMLDPSDDDPKPSLYFDMGFVAVQFRFEQAPEPMGLPGETSPRKFPSVQAAKATAQADYESRILSALEPSAPGGPMGWQDIATAPRDGRFFVWLQDEGFPVLASYRTFEVDTPEEYECLWIWEMDCSADWHCPTHWMSIPPPPKAAD